MVEFRAVRLMLCGGAVVVYWDNIYHSSTIITLYKSSIRTSPFLKYSYSNQFIQLKMKLLEIIQRTNKTLLYLNRYELAAITKI